ncbi:MAG: fasciclin domain-containing protein [Chloroflexota bacterium]|nr:fasciclin domain-containing protein [Chloroflexota bacterium]
MKKRGERGQSSYRESGELPRESSACNRSWELDRAIESSAAADVKTGQIPTVAGQSITIALQGGTVMVNNAKVIKTDVLTSNGVIHVIDAVLLLKM